MEAIVTYMRPVPNELRAIGGNAPSTYLAHSQRSAGIDDTRMNHILRSHLIDPESLRSDDFESFFGAREAALLGRIEETMGKRIARDIPEEIAQGDLASVEEYQNEEEE